MNDDDPHVFDERTMIEYIRANDHLSLDELEKKLKEVLRDNWTAISGYGDI